MSETKKNVLRWLIICIFSPLFSFSQPFDAALIKQETHITISNNARLKKDIHYEVQINNRAGEKYSTIALPYSKLYKLSKIKAFIKDPEGKIVKKLKKSEITVKSSFADYSFYEDHFIKEFTLKHNSYPYTIVYSYQVKQNEFLLIDKWMPLINKEVPTYSAELKLSVPVDYEISYVTNHIKSHEIDTLKNSVTYQWNTHYTNILSRNVCSPPISDFLPSLIITPHEYNYEIEGSFKDWTSYGNWQFTILKDLKELPDNEKNKIRSLIRNSKNDKEKIRILYHYLQDETRYINITIETGGLKPYSANYVSNNKFGDCKALTNYFQSVLEFIGIDAYYAKVHAGNPIRKINKNVPFQQFNHVILYIPLDQESIWLDCTSDGPFNYIGSFTQNRDALVICQDSSYFLKTPALYPSDVLDSRRIYAHYNSNTADVIFKNSYRGASYENLIHLEKNYNESEKTKIIREYFLEDGLELVDYSISQKHRDSAVIEINYDIRSNHVYNHYGNDIMLQNFAFSLPHFEDPANRQLPVQIDYPVNKKDTLIYKIPPGYKLSENFHESSINGKYGYYKYKVLKKKDQIMVFKSLLIKAGYIPVSEYEKFYNFYKQVFNFENKINLMLQKKI